MYYVIDEKGRRMTDKDGHEITEANLETARKSCWYYLDVEYGNQFTIIDAESDEPIEIHLNQDLYEDDDADNYAVDEDGESRSVVSRVQPDERSE